MKIKCIVAFVLTIAIMPLTVYGQDKISVAVTESFMPVFKEIAADFEDKTGMKVEATYASTGSLYSRIKKGTPYDVFLAADEARPAQLQKEKRTQGTFIYARDKLVVQHGCILKKAKNPLGAELFMDYLLCEHAAKIRNKYGYQ